ncbi:hypothetical protein ACR6C2_43340 [Streptomyces sp. INA 01156]
MRHVNRAGRSHRAGREKSVPGPASAQRAASWLEPALLAVTASALTAGAFSGCWATPTPPICAGLWARLPPSSPRSAGF